MLDENTAVEETNRPDLPLDRTTEEKKKRGRPRKTPGEPVKKETAQIPESVINSSAAALTTLTIVLLDFAHRSIKKNPIAVPPELNQALNESLKEICRKYGSILGSYGPEIGLATILYMIWISNNEHKENESKTK